MFTGLIEERGRIIALTEFGDSIRLTIEGPEVLKDAVLGDSIAVNGCCLTVAALAEETASFDADVMRESLNRTALADIKIGDEVNLERAMLAGTRFGGHMVQGHVDGTGVLLDREHSERWDVLKFSAPAALAKYIVEKGSITVDGTSLTVVEIHDQPEPWFSVSLIPTTLKETTLGSIERGDRVNLEVDVLAKYVERLLAKGSHR